MARFFPDEKSPSLLHFAPATLYSKFCTVPDIRCFYFTVFVIPGVTAFTLVILLQFTEFRLQAALKICSCLR